MKHLTRFTLFLLLPLVACWQRTNPTEPTGANQRTYKPVYIPKDSASLIAFEAAKPTTVAGRIYAYGDYLFQNDKGTGIHIIDNHDPEHPQKVAFLNIPLCTEIAIRNHYLYTNNLADMVVIDLADVQHPSLVKRLPDMFPNLNENQQFPAVERGVLFECPDPAKGVVKEWIVAPVSNPQCKTL